MRIATLFVLLGALPLLAGSITTIQNCSGNYTCLVHGDIFGVGTAVFSARVDAQGDNLGRGGPGPGGFGSVSIHENLSTDGPVRDGLIEFSYYGGLSFYGTGWIHSGGADSGASFTVGSYIGQVPGETGVPRPLAGQFLPFTLGAPFEVTLNAFFDVPPAQQGDMCCYRYGSADIDLSFSIYDITYYTYPPTGETIPLIGPAVPIYEASSDMLGNGLEVTLAPEPGTIWTVTLALLLLLAVRRTARRAPAA